MNNFCFYNAKGYIYARDHDGESIKSKVLDTIQTRGCVQHDEEMYGAILRQNPDLLKCDRVDFETWGV